MSPIDERELNNDIKAGIFGRTGNWPFGAYDRGIHSHSCERKKSTEVSSLCQPQYRKPTGGFFAAFTQAGSTASVSASMASSCGRYQMTAAMLTKGSSTRALQYSSSPALQYPNTPTLQ